MIGSQLTINAHPKKNIKIQIRTKLQPGLFRPYFEIEKHNYSFSQWKLSQDLMIGSQDEAGGRNH